MKFPFIVIPDLSNEQIDRYHNHVDSEASGWHRRFTESIWRRHQHPSNATLSGWRGPEDRKRRLLHFYDEYGLDGRSFVLRHAYLVMNVTLPSEHIDEYESMLHERLRQGEWRERPAAFGQQIYARGDLEATLTRRRVHPQDIERCSELPKHYENLDVVVKTANASQPAGWSERPWHVFFDVGLRKTLTRQTPQLLDPEALVEYFPAQLELGCGPSIEAGIPHLSTLHRIYGVSRGDYGFIFRAEQDGLLTLFADPEAKYREMTNIYRACMTADSTEFYVKIKQLHNAGHLVGPVITNNFDCQCAVMGMPEISLRRYDWVPYYPTIKYDHRAKSLLVVGVHADRRLVQMRARAHGLKIVFVDPEAYVSPDGSQIPYPIEAPQADDVLVRAPASAAFRRLQ